MISCQRLLFDRSSLRRFEPNSLHSKSYFPARSLVCRSWICEPTESLEFASAKLDILVKNITVENCDRMNRIIALAHDVDDMYTSQIELIVAMIVFIVFFGLINFKISK